MKDEKIQVGKTIYLVPMSSMYGISTHIWLIFMVHVGKLDPKGVPERAKHSGRKI